jgi:shikimate dehydrogenase
VAELFLVNRTESKAEEVAREIKQRAPRVSVQIGYPSGRLDLLLNATSLGLKTEDSLPFDGRSFSLSNAAAVYDMIYRPAETRFLKEAARNGCKITNGLGMLLYQGAKALEIWTGQPAPLEVMRTALREHIYGATSQHSN